MSVRRSGSRGGPLLASEDGSILASADATAVYTGLRKGELIGLRKKDVDLKRRLLTVERSYERDTTKGGHSDVIPIAAELEPYLRAALRGPSWHVLFPRPDGSNAPRGQP